jgi:hypothetical protein
MLGWRKLRPETVGVLLALKVKGIVVAEQVQVLNNTVRADCGRHWVVMT